MNSITRRLTITATIAATVFLSATTCLPIDRVGAEMTITNQTEHRLGIHISDTESERVHVPAGTTIGFSLNGNPPECTEWPLRVFTEDFTRTASIGPPVCHGDEWVITDADLHPVEP